MENEVAAPGASRFGEGDSELGVQRISDAAASKASEDPAAHDALRVRVLGLDGAPKANWRVVVRSRTTWTAPGAPGLELLSATSDRDGAASFPRARTKLARAWNERCTIGLEDVWPPLPAEVLDPASAFDREIVLRAPACGSVRIRIRGLDGAAIENGAPVRLHVVADSAETVRPAFFDMPARSERLTLSGTATYPHVQLGLELGCSTAMTWESLEAYARITPLTREDETREIDLEYGRGDALLTALLLTPAGAVLADESVDIGVRHRELAWHESVRTDAMGQFHLRLKRLGEAASTGRIWITHDPEGTASLELAPQYADGVHDLGTLVLSPAAPAFSGIVIDDAGCGVAGAMVSFAHVANEESYPWFSVRVFTESTSTDAGGRFDWPASPPLWTPAGGRRALQAHLNDLASPRVLAAEGTQGIVLRLEATASVTAVVRLDEDSPLERLSAALVPRKSTESIHRAIARESTWCFEDVVPGTYDLVVVLNDFPEWRRKIENIALHAGTNRDARLEPLDLRGAFAPLEIGFVTEPPGQEIPWWRGGVELKPAGSTEIEPIGIQLTQQSELRALAPAGASYDAVVRIAGFREVRLAGVSGKSRVVLRPSIPVELSWPQDAIASAGGSTVYPHLIDEESLSPVDFLFVVPSRATHPRAALLPRPGRWRVYWIAQQSDGNSSISQQIPGADPAWIEVLDQAEVQRFELRPP